MRIAIKKAISRRTVLRGIGASLALPVLDAMLPAFTRRVAAATAVRRFGVVFVPHGVRPDDMWNPQQAGRDFDFAPIMKPLEPFRSHVTVVTNCDGIVGGHAPSTAQWLTGSRPKPTIAEDVRAGVSIDQVIARQVRGDTPLPSLELATEDFSGYIGGCDPGYSCTYENTLCWKSATEAIPMEVDPRAVFQRLFGRPGTAAQRIARMNEDRSILDSVAEDLADLGRRIGASDRARLDSYLENVREIEQRIQKAERKVATNVSAESPIGIPETFEEHAHVMYDLMALAWEADLTRVTTFMKCRDLSQRVYANLGISEPHHSMSHHGGDPIKIANLVKVNTYHLSLFAKFIERLRTTQDGDGTLLDHSVIVYGSGMRESNGHTNQDLPTLVVGHGAGLYTGNLHVKAANNTPLANFWLGLADKFGVEMTNFGLSTGRLEV